MTREAKVRTYRLVYVPNPDPEPKVREYRLVHVPNPDPEPAVREYRVVHVPNPDPEPAVREYQIKQVQKDDPATDNLTNLIETVRRNSSVPSPRSAWHAIVHERAEAYRTLQAEMLLTKAGFVEGPDGKWHRPATTTTTTATEGQDEDQ